MLAELAADPLAISIRPGGLSVDGVRGVIEQRLGQAPDAPFAEACHTATGGNPLLLHELMKAIAVEGTAPTAANTGVVSELGPRAASRAVLLRLSRLSAEAGRWPARPRSSTRASTCPTLAALAGVDEQVAARATGELSQAEILRPAQPLGFVHPLIRAAVYQEVSPGERELAHARAARLLAEAGAPGRADRLAPARGAAARRRVDVRDAARRGPGGDEEGRRRQRRRLLSPRARGAAARRASAPRRCSSSAWSSRSPTRRPRSSICARPTTGSATRWRSASPPTCWRGR